jgi:hypothetical protein
MRLLIEGAHAITSPTAMHQGRRMNMTPIVPNSRSPEVIAEEN